MKFELTDNQRTRLQRIRLLVLDVDGVLTDGRIYFGNEGEALKSFSILDGLGIKLLERAAIKTALITGRTSGMVAARARELGITICLQGREDKLKALGELCADTGLSLEECAYCGDDLPDLAAIRQAGFGFTVANAHWFVKQYADYCTGLKGGHGAVREICDLILESRNLLEKTLHVYLD